MANTCKYCGKIITAKSHKKNGTRVFCDIDCFKKYRGVIDWKYVNCQYCGKQFKETRDRPNLFCSKGCSSRFYSMMNTTKKEVQNEHDSALLEEYREALRRVEEIKYRIEHEKYCIECGKLFIASNSRMVYCSEKCRKRHDNRRKDKRIYRNGTPDLSITLSRLYDRDGGQCQICGRYIDFECDSNSDDYPSIDHIVPLARGGLHQWDNVQLACRRCNTLKRDKLIPAPIAQNEQRS